MRWRRRALLAMSLIAAPRLARAALQAGSGRIAIAEPSGATADPLPIWYHRPATWRPGGAVVAVMHGLNRNADGYRDDWVSHADRHGFLAVVVEFGRHKYPATAWYNFGGALDEAGQARSRADWSFFALDRAVSALQHEAGAPDGPFALYGHSAGAQFVHRYLLLTGAPRVSRLIIANAGSYTLPDLTLPFPQGLAGTAATEADLRAAFARPVTILLGEADTDPNHASLPRQTFAQAQGPHRFARGEFFVAASRRAAGQLGVPLAWQVVTVPGVGHSNAGMAVAAAPLLVGR